MEGRAMIQAAASRRKYDARELPRVSYVLFQVTAVEKYFLLRKNSVLLVQKLRTSVRSKNNMEATA
jgi:hypothetical protein